MIREVKFKYIGLRVLWLLWMRKTSAQFYIKVLDMVAMNIYSESR